MSPYPAAASPRQITVAFVNCFGAEPPPTAVMPVWAFEPDPENSDLLLSSATLWNCNLLAEALRVEATTTRVLGLRARPVQALGRRRG